MLKGIDPLLSGELLRLLDDMGHGDLLLLVDRNYPAAASGRPVVRLGETTILRAAETGLGFKLLNSTTGGKHGGGATLTPEAEAILAAYERYCAELRQYASALFETHFHEFLR